MFVDIKNNEINYVHNVNLSRTQQDHSYIVVYEDSLASKNDAATPVVTKIVDNNLFFKAAKNHEAGRLPNGTYSLYYGSDYIKYISATPITSNSSTSYEYVKKTSSEINQLESSPGYSPYYSATPPSINLYSTEINKNSIGYYKLAYFNDGIDWVDGISKKINSKLVANFSGPNIKVYGAVGPGYGKCRIRITTKNQSSDEVEDIVLDWYEIDCYSTQERQIVIFEKNNLDYLEYILELEVIADKNILSTSNEIYVNKITFLRNFHFSLGNQILNPNLIFKSIGGLR